MSCCPSATTRCRPANPSTARSPSIALDQEQTLLPAIVRRRRVHLRPGLDRVRHLRPQQHLRPQELHAGRPQHGRVACRADLPGQGPGRPARPERLPGDLRGRHQRRLPGLRLPADQRSTDLVRVGRPDRARSTSSRPAPRSPRATPRTPASRSAPPPAPAGSSPARPRPIDMTLSTRERAAPADQRLRTLILMQGNGGATQPNVGSWEYTLPNGIYDVTVTRRRCRVHRQHPSTDRRGRARHRRLRADDRRAVPVATRSR